MNLIEVPTLIRVDGGKFRTYRAPSGRSYPSVTSVLGAMPNPELDAWRVSVGPKEAKRISARAASRGTRFHSMCEAYLKGEPANPTMFEVELFNPFKKVLNRISDVICLETQLWSDKLQMAGTVDCVGKFDLKPFVMDFKTSEHVKYVSMIRSYFLQVTAYSLMLEERAGISIKDLVILMSTDGSKPQLFYEHRSKWIKPLLECRSNFRLIYGV